MSVLIEMYIRHTLSFKLFFTTGDSTYTCVFIRDQPFICSCWPFMWDSTFIWIPAFLWELSISLCAYESHGKAGIYLERPHDAYSTLLIQQCCSSAASNSCRHHVSFLSEGWGYRQGRGWLPASLSRLQPSEQQVETAQTQAVKW